MKKVSNIIKGKESKDVRYLSDWMSSYIKGLSKYKVLSKEEENELIRRWREEGDERAYHLLINSNARFVVYVAFRVGAKKNIDDVIQAGLLGLSVALNRYDNSMGYRLISYAYFFIYRYIIDEIKRHNCDVKSVDDYVDDDDKECRIIDMIGKECDETAMYIRSDGDRWLLNKIREVYGDESVRVLSDYIVNENKDIDKEIINSVKQKIRCNKRLVRLYAKIKRGEI